MTSVLAVDDDPAILRTLSINLRARSYEVQTAADGRSALQIVAEEEPDVIILDLGLPDMDGIAVLRQLRSARQTPVVVLSARQESDDIVEALDEGADDYVTKPFGMEELLARVRTALRRGPGRSPAHGGARPEIWSWIWVSSGPGGPERRCTSPRPSGDWSTRWPDGRDSWSGSRSCSTRSGGPPTRARRTICGSILPSCAASWRTSPPSPRHFLTEPGVGYRFMP